MSLRNKILLALIVVFIAIQFIQPARNKSGHLLSTDFIKIYKVPDTVRSILLSACYDCHSNDTRYPWYSRLEPIAWMMSTHIKKGKDHLNFSDFGGYTSRRQISKLKEMANQVNDNEMPIFSYKIMHKIARLSQEQKYLIIDWINKTADSLSVGK